MNDAGKPTGIRKTLQLLRAQNASPSTDVPGRPRWSYRGSTGAPPALPFVGVIYRRSSQGTQKAA